MNLMTKIVFYDFFQKNIDICIEFPYSLAAGKRIFTCEYFRKESSFP